MIFQKDLTGFRSRVAHDSCKGVSLIFACDFAFSFRPALADLTLVFYLLLEKFNDSFTVGHAVKLPIVNVLIRLHHNPFALRKTLITPFPSIILIQKLMLHHLMLIKKMPKFFVSQSVPSWSCK